MNTLAMNVGYSADSGFLEEPLVQLLSNNPLINSTQKTLLSSWVFYNASLLSAGDIGSFEPGRGSYRLKLLTARHGYLSGFKVGHKTSQANKWLTEQNRRFLT